MARRAAQDVVELIIQDHREVQRLFERLQESPDARALLFPQLAALLTAHSRAEEAEVYPSLADAAGLGVASHSREEHAEADELVGRLKTTDPNAAAFERSMNKLIKSMNAHIEEEESEILPALRANTSARRLGEMAAGFLARRTSELMHGPSPRPVPGTEMSRQALYRKAGQHHIPGRSRMTREQLYEAVQKVESNSHG